MYRSSPLRSTRTLKAKNVKTLPRFSGRRQKLVGGFIPSKISVKLDHFSKYAPNMKKNIWNHHPENHGLVLPRIKKTKTSNWSTWTSGVGGHKPSTHGTLTEATLTKASRSLATNGIDLINEDDAWSVFLSLAEEMKGIYRPCVRRLSILIFTP